MENSYFSTQKVRSAVRHVIALSFWIHAIYVTQLLPIHFQSNLNWPRYLYNFSILTFIFYYSLCSNNGWLSVLFDLIYVYFWPFIVFAKATWVGIKFGYRYLRRKIIWTSPGLITRVVPAKSLAQSAPDEKTKKEEAVESIWALRPFVRFVALWAVLILSVNSKWFILFAVIVTLVGAGRAIYSLWQILSDTSSWIEKLKGTFANQIAQHIRSVRAWNETSGIEEVTKAANALKLLEAVFVFISVNKEFLAKSTMVLAALISIPFYCYVSFLFSCVYVGLAKLQAISFPWPTALLDSLYMPFAFTNLPSNFAIQFLGGLQALVVTFIGWNIFFRHLSSRFQRIAVAASELHSPFDDAAFRQKLGQIERVAMQDKTIEGSKPEVLVSVLADATPLNDHLDEGRPYAAVGAKPAQVKKPKAKRNGRRR